MRYSRKRKNVYVWQKDSNGVPQSNKLGTKSMPVLLHRQEQAKPAASPLVNRPLCSPTPLSKGTVTNFLTIEGLLQAIPALKPFYSENINSLSWILISKPWDNISEAQSIIQFKAWKHKCPGWCEPKERPAWGSADPAAVNMREISL